MTPDAPTGELIAAILALGYDEPNNSSSAIQIRRLCAHLSILSKELDEARASENNFRDAVAENYGLVGLGVLQAKHDEMLGWKARAEAAEEALRKAEASALRLLLTDLVRSSAAVEADLAEFGTITSPQGYSHWNDTIDAASGYLAKDAPDPINETAALPPSKPEEGYP